MRLRFRHEEDCRDTGMAKFGVVSVELAPQYRTIFTNSGFLRLPFPYLIFGIGYYIDKKGKFIYPDVSLSVSLSKTSLKTFQDQLFVCPTENYHVICTDHKFDGKSFNTLEELTKFYINLWFGLNHHKSQAVTNWSRLKLEEVHKINQINIMPYFDVLKCLDRSDTQNFMPSEIIDQDFQKESKKTIQAKAKITRIENKLKKIVKKVKPSKVKKTIIKKRKIKNLK